MSVGLLAAHIPILVCLLLCAMRTTHSLNARSHCWHQQQSHLKSFPSHHNHCHPFFLRENQYRFDIYLSLLGHSRHTRTEITTTKMEMANDTNDEKMIENSGSKKRTREEEAEGAQKVTTLEELSKDKQNPRMVRQRSESNNDPDLLSLRQLRLEAIFHPKFENESQSNGAGGNSDGGDSKRKNMLEQVSKGHGYLEASLKHSGSLLLWSGEQRYYSKNSTDNAFSMVGEILLRQHFARAWWLNDESSSDVGCGDEVVVKSGRGEEKYKECSSYVLSNRLTLAFEVVTSVLGHHGSIPKKDFLVLTAVADKSCERFYSTAEVARMAQKFRLPHNDYWTFRTETSAKSLFEWYDREREVALAKGVCKDMDNITDGRRLRSLYPHSDFQGEIVEGIVVRYVPYSKQFQNATAFNNTSDGADVVMEEGEGVANDHVNAGQVMDQLAIESERILDLVPPERPPSFVIFSSAKKDEEINSLDHSKNAVLTTDVRELYSKNTGNDEVIENALCSVLTETDGQRRTIHRLGKSKGQDTRGKKNAVDVPGLVNELLLANSNESANGQIVFDTETIRIANLIQTLHSMNRSIEFKLLKEEMIPTAAKKNGGKKVSNTTRWLCIIHVMRDSVFPQYMKKMDVKKDMMLYRGFCVQMMLNGDEDIESPEYCRDTTTDTTVGDDGPPLMLKMKFLPYMVRTFGCRNGLKILEQKGVLGFEQYTTNLLMKWGMSSTAINTWRPFFSSWGSYANEMLQQNGNQRRKEGGGKGIMTQNEDLPPLTAQNYLHHLERFNKLFEEGKIGSNNCNAQSKNPCDFRGAVIVVSLNKEDASVAADLLSASLGGCRRSSNVNGISEDDMHLAMSPVDGGLVVDAVVEDGFGALRKHCKKFEDAIHVVLVGCDDEVIDASIDISMRDKKKQKGMLKGWRKCKCKTVVDVPQSCFSTASVGKDGSCDGDVDKDPSSLSESDSEELPALVKKLITLSGSLPKADERPGALLFFPGIPGSGKSTLCGAVSTESLCAKLDQMDAHMNDDGKISLSKKEGANEKTGESNSNFDRPVIVRVGDAVKEKYWPLVKRERLEHKPSLYVADKNSTPTVWNTIAEVCAESRGVFAPVLPDSAALSTTTLMFAASADGSYKREYVFPFSLQYLAVCLSRVLQRPQKSHRGKLDAATDNACMIVVKFFCLYKGLTADRVKETCEDMANEAGTVQIGSDTFFITVPFFVDNSPRDLPKDLHDALVDAIQLQVCLGFFLY
uniref:tRNA ligase phosphodiesterase domain-containing protein n=1 Tax=Ditylum brightwellii TaxID=49249 RepID=A0A7S4SIA2_9STRA